MFREDNEINLIEKMAELNKNRISWDKHEKLNVFTTEDSLIISYKILEDTKKDHKILKKLYRPFGKEKLILEFELTNDTKANRKKKGRSLKFLKDGTIDFQNAPDHFLFERISSCSENNKIAAQH